MNGTIGLFLPLRVSRDSGWVVSLAVIASVCHSLFAAASAGRPGKARAQDGARRGKDFESHFETMPLPMDSCDALQQLS